MALRRFAAGGIAALLCVAAAMGGGALPAAAVTAAPGVRTLTQADGTTFSAVAWGDENHHGQETLDGYQVVFEERRREWHYATPNAAGELVSSGVAVGRASPLSVRSSRRPPRPTRPAGPARATRRESAGPVPLSAPSPAGPTAGAPAPRAPAVTNNVPVILVNFTDRTATFTAADFTRLLFGAAGYTMKTYYEEVSYGAFSVSPGPSGVAGWYTAARGHDFYGQNDASGWDRWPGDLVSEAVAAADATYDFAPYDQDGDCYVDAVNIVHQGTGEEASPTATDIWSHRWSLSAAKLANYGTQGVYTTNDACPAGGFIKVDDYVIQPEKYQSAISTVGVFAHEYGHALGLPDLYDTDGSSEGLGSWSLMASGSWNGVGVAGNRPAHLDAWCKYRLGWVAPQRVAGQLAGESIAAAACAAPCSGDVYQLLAGSPAAGGEYFLVENRQRLGFDAGLPGAGLLVWHVDEGRASNDTECSPPAVCAANHYHVALVQADNLWHLEKNANRGDAGDPFPGSAGRTSLGAATSPSSRLYSGASSSTAISAIGPSGNPMTATLEAGLCAPPGAPGVPATSYTGSYTVSWAASATPGAGYVLEEATAADFSAGLRSAYAGPDTVAPIADRTPGTTYHYRVRAVLGGFADSAWVTGANGCSVLLAPPGAFAKLAPVDGAGAEEPALTLTWSPSAGAAAYEYCIDATDDGACPGGWVGTGAAQTASLSLSLGTVYSWQVRATNGSGVPTYADGGAWWRLTTRFPPRARGWEVHVGGAGTPDEGTDVAAQDGAVVVAGVLGGGARAWVGRYLADGSLQWERSWDGTASGVAAAPDGSVYVTGSSGTRLYLRKIAPDGASEAWVRKVRGRGRGVVAAPDGSAVYTVGSGPGGALVEKRTAAGALLWRRYATGSAGASGTASGAAVDGEGNLYVAGTLKSAGHGRDIWLAKYSPSGRRSWSRTVSSPGRRDDRGSAVVVDASGVYVAGTIHAGARHQAWAARYTTAGGRVWSSTREAAGFPAVRGGDLAIAADRTLTVAGTATAADGTERGYLWRLGQADGGFVAEDLREPGAELASGFSGIATQGTGLVVTGRRVLTPGDADLLIVSYE